ncbi:MAG: Nicotinate-nucleotide adenylyltransferase [Actinomycetota bacterium]|jgi:nicotinate-nucleotide adenylyltransferase
MSPLRLGIFGGTFDPIHNGHLVAARAALTALNLDIIYFVPTWSSLAKHHSASGQQRADMVQLAIADEPKFKISRVDIDRGSPTFTIDTLQSFSRQHPEAKLYFLLGVDAFQSISTWKESQKLAELAEFVVLSRPGYEFAESGMQSNYLHSSLVIDALDISSTDIRHRLEKSGDPGLKVPAKVLGYIREHGLYSGQE